MTRTLLPLALLFVGTAALADQKSELKALAGTWVVKSAEIDGKDVTESFKAATLVIAGDQYTVTFGELVDKGTLAVDAAKTPKTMDVTGVEGVNRGKAFPCLYELKDGALTVCYGMDHKTRPTDLTTAQGNERLKVVYTRKK